MRIADIFSRLFIRNHIDLGNRGERKAVKFLKKNRYEIIKRNFRMKTGEIDIIAKERDELVFIEVKTRSSDSEEFLKASVNRGKEKRLIKTASCYLSKPEYQNFKTRFDVIFIIDNKRGTKIEHIKDVFSLN